jgi:hypothetical protein
VAVAGTRQGNKRKVRYKLPCTTLETRLALARPTRVSRKARRLVEGLKGAVQAAFRRLAAGESYRVWVNIIRHSRSEWRTNEPGQLRSGGVNIIH